MQGGGNVGLEGTMDVYRGVCQGRVEDQFWEQYFQKHTVGEKEKEIRKLSSIFRY